MFALRGKRKSAAPPKQGAQGTPAGRKKLPGLTERERKRLALHPPSFTDLLPWMECDQDGVFLLEDGVSRGLMYELDPIPTEATSEAYLKARMAEVQSALSTLPEHDEAEWVVQFYVNDDTGLELLLEQFRDYVLDANAANPERGREILGSVCTQAFMRDLDAHLQAVSVPQGFFVDEAVSGNPWRGQIRRVRLALYRRYPPHYDFSEEAFSPAELLKQTADGLIAGLRESGIRAHRMLARDFYNWLVPFFNPRPFGDVATTVSEILRRCPYPGEAPADQPFGVDLGDLLMLDMPESDPKTGTWTFNGKPMRALALQGLRKSPQVGHFTAERQYADKHFARFDRMPSGSMLSCTMVAHPQDLTKARVQGVQGASLAKTPDAALAHEEASQVLSWMSHGDKLYPFFMTLYVRGDDEADLRSKVAEVAAAMQTSGLRFIDPRHELIGCDVFIRGLPMCFDPRFDAREMRRGRLVWASQIAALLPVYGRSRGTGHAGFWLWNRGGEPLFVDPLNKRDRKKNAHLLMLGPTGAGKSATLNYLCMLMMAIYRPRLVIADAGKSFELLKQHFAALGLKTYSVELTPDTTVSLPPFANACRLLDEMADEERLVMASVAPDVDDDVHAEDDDEDVDDAEEGDDAAKRDLLGEMVLQARLMITGGERSEEARMGRADRYLIQQAILAAARTARAQGVPHPRSEDVAQALMAMRSDSELGVARQARAEEMGQAMLVFCDGLRGKLFNRYGESWPDADVTLVEMGTLAQEGYEDALSLAYTSLVNHVQALAESTHYEGRPIIFLTDEGHIITKNPLLAPYVVKITKMWRKLGCWFWLATQNMEDFPDEARRMLAMCEWWILLTMDRDEIEQVARFRTLTLEQRRMMESAAKEPPKYTEGVILASAVQALFRNVPPALPIALAMTEQHEKAQRRTIMEARGCSELEAAYEVARQLAARRAYS
jgi:conjugative transfer ATPase